MPKQLRTKVVLKATKLSPGQGKAVKLTKLKPGDQFKFGNVGGDVETFTAIAQTPKAVIILRKGGNKLQQMPLPFFQNSKVILLPKG